MVRTMDTQRAFRCLSPLTIAALTAISLVGASKERVIQTNSAGDNVHVIDPSTNKVVGTIEGIDVPHGTVISPQILSMIERAEDALLALGFREVRVRHHGKVALLEIPPQEFERALRHREPIVQGVRGAGYQSVALDLAGMRPQSPALVRLTLAQTKCGTLL